MVTGGQVRVAGPKGSLELKLPPETEVVVSKDEVEVKVKDPHLGHIHGLIRSLVANMVKGVVEGWSKTLELTGTGFRAATDGGKLTLALGFSHPVIVSAPPGITFEVKENRITISGADKRLVGEIAAKVRKLKPADPYKAKGFKYEGEIIMRKAGKAAKTTA